MLSTHLHVACVPIDELALIVELFPANAACLLDLIIARLISTAGQVDRQDRVFAFMQGQADPGWQVFEGCSGTERSTLGAVVTVDDVPHPHRG